jgi:hypothetical protein
MNWSALEDVIVGIVMLGIFAVSIGSMIMFFVGAANGSYKRRPPRRRHGVNKWTAFHTSSFNSVK